MTKPLVTITHSSLTPNTKVIQCQSITVGGQRTIDPQPWANADGPTEVHVNAFENQRIAVGQIFFDSSSQETRPELLTETDVLNLVKLFYDGTNAPVLNVKYGHDGEKSVLSLAMSPDIPVIVENYSIPIDVRDSKNAYIPTGNLSLVETTNS